MGMSVKSRAVKAGSAKSPQVGRSRTVAREAERHTPETRERREVTTPDWARSVPPEFIEPVESALAADDWGATSRTEIERLLGEDAFVSLLTTPTVGAYFIMHANSGNRKIIRNRAHEHAEIITTGRYINTGNPVVVSDNRNLNSGQHRLLGLILSGHSVPMDFRFGISRKAYPVTDTGAIRKASDVIGSGGEANPNLVAAVSKLILAYSMDDFPGSYRKKRHNDEIVEAYERWPDIAKAVEAATTLLNGRRRFVNAASAAFTFLALRQVGKAGRPRLEEFLGLVESGLFGRGEAKNPARQLREMMLNDDALTSGVREAIVTKFALFAKAWNMWNEGSTDKLRWRGFDERSPEPFPRLSGVKL